MARYVVNIEDIVRGFVHFGGEAHTNDIQSYVLRNVCLGVIPDNYSTERSFRMTVQRKIEDYCPQSHDFNPTKFSALFTKISRGVYVLNDYNDDGHFAEQVIEGEAHWEGATKIISVNAYERSKKARNSCIRHYGAKCYACGFDFKKTYGLIAEGHIHVHHIVPLSEIGQEYVIDPIKDLRPVCANCHSVLHLRRPAFSIDELKKLLVSNRS